MMFHDVGFSHHGTSWTLHAITMMCNNDKIKPRKLQIKNISNFLKIINFWKIGILIGIFLKKMIFSHFFKKMPIKMPIFKFFEIFVIFGLSWICF